MKAGLMEIADIFVINKADRPGAERFAQELEVMLQLRRGDGTRLLAGHHGVSRSGRGSRRGEASVPAAAEGKEEAVTHLESEGWTIPVLQTIAVTGEGTAELAATLDRHRGYLVESGELSRRRRSRAIERTRAAVERELAHLAWKRGPGELMLRAALPALEAGDESPYSVAARIVAEVARRMDGSEDT
jgi:LAO/AO transport system kinase